MRKIERVNFLKYDFLFFSGHPTIRRMLKDTEIGKHLLNGLKGWKTKVEISAKTGQPVHNSASQSAASRRMKKLVGK